MKDKMIILRTNSAADSTAADDARVSEEQVFKVAKRKAAEKERRTKKRNERPPPSEEEKTLPARPAKRIKSVVSRQRKTAGSSKGNVSKPNPISNSEAQTSKHFDPIDYTKPLNVILPSSPSSSSSSSEGTPFDYSTDTAEILRKSDKNLNKIQKNNPPKKKTPLKKTPQKTPFKFRCL
jgi:hypothetical protein